VSYAASEGFYCPELPPIIVHHQFSEPDTYLEICLPTDQIVPGKGEIERAILPGGCVSSVIHLGEYYELATTYPALGMWIEQHGYIANGPPRIAVLTNHAVVTNPAEFRTEAIWPIRPARKAER
jgi:effector-binding domain-containing protein